MMALVVFVC